MARDVTKYLCRLALGSTLSLAGLSPVAAEEPRAAQEAHIKVQDAEPLVKGEELDQPEPLAADPKADRLTRDIEKEVVTERFPSRAVRIEREVAQDSDGNYYNHGAWSQWDENGVLKGSGEYRHGRRHGKWVRWFNAGESKVLSSATYKSFQAPFVAEATFDDGKLQGTWTITDTQGRLASEWQFENGEMHGKCVWYFSSGQKQREADYVNGQIEGQLLEWTLESEKPAIKNGRVVTVRGEPVHKLVTKDFYESGRRQSGHTEFYSPGVRKAEGMYLFAKEITKTNYDFWNGEIYTSVIGKEGINQRHGKWTWYYKNGGKQLEGEFDHDKPVGKHVWWHANGQKQAQGEYESGLETGEWTWWHASGQKMTEGQFAHGAQTGRWTRWNELGLVVESHDFDKVQLADETQPVIEESAPAVAAQPQRSTLRQPRPLKIESARRTPPTRKVK